MRTLESQTLIDIAIQACGSAEAAYDISVLNGMSITDDVESGTELIIPEVVNKPISTYYANKGYKPATNSIADTAEVERVFFPEMPIEFS